MTDLNTPDVEQPDDGQDDGGTQAAPYAEYLDRIPEQLRGDVEPVFKDWDANVTRRFQESAELRKQFEPLKETGIHELDPEAVSWLVTLHGALDKPEVMQQWWQSYAQENGLTVAEAQAEAEADTGLEDFGVDDFQRFEKALEERLSPLQQKLDAYEQRFAQSDQQQALAEAQRYVDGQLSELATKHNDGTPFDQEMVDLIERFSAKYEATDPLNAIPKGFADLQKFINGTERQTLQAKLAQPKPAEGGGVPDVSPERHKRIDDPAVREQVLAMLRNSG